MSERDRNAGLYKKYIVERTDGSTEPGGKHEKCFTFVLDIHHDVHARRALHAYMRSCEEDFPALARDLATVLNEHSDY